MPKYLDAVVDRDFVRLPNGVLKVAHPCPDFRSPYQKAPVPNVIAVLDHKEALDKKEYEKRLEEQEIELSELVFKKLVGSRRFVIVEFIGYDASGKSGALKHIQEGLRFNAKIFRVVPYGKPSAEELEYHWLFKYGRHERLPKYGQIYGLDRGPSERLLVERVKELAPSDDLTASFNQMNAWHWLLHQQGGIIIRFWMDITKQEQWKRFMARAHDAPEKLSPDDMEARKKRRQYQLCANEMFMRTGTDFAPWYVLSSEDKRYSRVAVLEIINQTLRSQLS